jgi:hypothetical protein
MRPTTTEATTGGVDPVELAAAQDPVELAAGAEVLDVSGPGAVTVRRVSDVAFDPLAQKLTDRGAAVHVEPASPPVAAYTFTSPEERERFQRAADERGLSLIDYLRQVGG